MTLYKWSQTASVDATVDSTINWAEGQSPSSVNDSARAMMAATAKYRDDIAGAIVASGVDGLRDFVYQAFDTLAHLSGQMIAFTPHATNGATVTLNVDSLGAKPLRVAPGVEDLPINTASSRVRRILRPIIIRTAHSICTIWPAIPMGSRWVREWISGFRLLRAVRLLSRSGQAISRTEIMQHSLRRWARLTERETEARRSICQTRPSVFRL